MSHLDQLSPVLWVAQSQFYHTNAGIWLGGDRAVLVDPCMSPDEIEAIAGWVTAHGAPSTTILLTHGHWDHLLGAERWPQARVVAQAAYLPTLDEDRRLHVQNQVARWAESCGIQRRAPFSIPGPDETFEDVLDLQAGDLNLRLVHAPGHAPDLFVVYEPATATLWASDMLSDLEIPFVMHNLEAYCRTLEMISTWEIRVLVPGHGSYTMNAAEIRRRINEDTDYVHELRDRVSAACSAGKALQEAVDSCAAMSIRCPEDNADGHRLNVESAFLELGGLLADAGPVGWDRPS